MNAKIIQKLCSSVDFVNQILYGWKIGPVGLETTWNFLSQKPWSNYLFIYLFWFFFGLFFTLIVLQAFSILSIANLWIVCGVYQFSSLKCELASCLKAHPWTYPTETQSMPLHQMSTAKNLRLSTRRRNSRPSYNMHLLISHAENLQSSSILWLTLNTFATFWIPVKKFHKECWSHGAYAWAYLDIDHHPSRWLWIHMTINISV